MTCRHCKMEIPANLLVCPVCVNRNTRQHLITRESMYTGDIRAGRVQLRLTRPRRSVHSHLEFIFLAGQSYCGEPLATEHVRERVNYSPNIEHTICHRCWQTLQGMLRTAA